MKKLFTLILLTLLVVIAGCAKTSTTTTTVATTGTSVSTSTTSTTETTTETIDPSLLVWYKFDETGGRIAHDSSGHGYDGTLEGVSYFAKGENGNAVDLDGTSGYVQLPPGILNGVHNITVSAWVYLNTNGGSRWLFGLGPNNSKYIFLTPESNGGVLRGAITTNTYTSEQGAQTTMALPTGMWVSVALVLSGDMHTLTLYVNGSVVAQNTAVTLNPSDVYDATANFSGYIGKSLYSGDPYFQGKVDDFRIYDRALSTKEIQQIQFLPTDILSASLSQLKATMPTIDYLNHTITLPVGPGTDLTKLAPTFTLQTSGATISPASGSVQDFTHPVQYTVTGSDGSTQVWTVSAPVYGNPVLPGFNADPNVAFFNGTYYIYPTTDGYPGWGSTTFSVWSSKDLVTWTDDGVILNLANVTWGHGEAWAPTIAEKDGIYYFYFCDEGNIGVATSTSPTGPFKDALGKPLLAKGSYPGQMIDPQVFIDDDGQAYLYFGNSYLYVAKLNDDMISLASKPQNITPSGFREGVFMFKRDGKYYLTWSENDTGSATYQVAYAMSDSPYGPFVRLGTILREDPTLGILATGHESVLNIPGTDDYYMVYARWAIPNGDGTHRVVCIDKMEFNSDGTIIPIQPTLTGITTPVYPVN